ncbi:hypothetical protein DLD77_03715 [Chitinophaga alhagiae]|uniref:Uncharacterized protein n=1 Tax=Chitinophaga alhagiae TaxID=2203219 RepID=A0ABN5LSZ4_9BACT|nr:hypothetical protein DLD77_03715 [Chitinophaga alhagiae]
MHNIWYKTAGLTAAAMMVMLAEAGAQDAGLIGKAHFQFIEYPDFPEANSTWGDIGFNPKDQCVYVGVTNHRNKIGWYVYNTVSKSIGLKGFISDLGHLRPFQWQGKIHTKVVFDRQGAVYFGTDGGESREEYLMDHPKGYAGGYLMKWEPAQNKLVNLGMTLQYESIKDVDVDPFTGKIYAITYPQVHFIVYDPATNNMQDLGRLGSAHVPRVMFTDQWGNCYYVDWRQRLVKYEKSTGKLVFSPHSLPAFEGTPGEHIITGITGYAKDHKKGEIYFVTYGAKLVRFRPTEHGIGAVEDLGGVYEAEGRERWRYYVPNLNIGANGKLYYIIGGHGNFAKKDRTLLMEFDPETRRHRTLHEFAESELSEATGSDIRDNEGNIYFAGRKQLQYDKNSVHAQKQLDNGISVPFIFKFNPDKQLQ